MQRFVYDGNALITEYNASGTLLRRVACPEPVEGSMGAVLKPMTRWCGMKARR